MTSFRKALLFGVIIWVIPFTVALFIFPLRESWRALFESIMPLVITITTVSLGVAYFKKVESGFIKEGVVVGLLWLIICLVIDLPLMLSSPMNMSLVDYMADVGLTYLIIPAITMSLGMTLKSRAIE
ncbi:hypothetical protein BMS3Abin05_01941 [bacterium BMS3Abin05]|nr:hypothetical protein BMS3Abin05_01941 [bacterium BMS3Abin05]GBE28156.1 hypothetical protein BMS3Bbin03_02093 [bacterium BMS3Bbin03]HDL78854.1 hypothetical protein [Bacteroidota bacterium]